MFDSLKYEMQIMWQEEALSNCSSMKICTALSLSLLIFSAVDTQNVLKNSQQLLHFVNTKKTTRQFALSIYPESLLQPRDSLSEFTPSHFSSHETLTTYSEPLLQPRDSLSAFSLSHLNHETRSQHLLWVTSTMRLAFSIYPESLQPWDSLSAFTLSHFSSDIKLATLRS
jgi:hypothetical protein